MSAYLVLAPPDDDLEPHPELVRVQRPDAALFMAVAVTLGVFPAASHLLGDGWL